MTYRYLLYIRGPGQVYLLDRDNTVFLAKTLSFPSRKSPDGHVTETLADSVSYSAHVCDLIVLVNVMCVCLSSGAGGRPGAVCSETTPPNL